MTPPLSAEPRLNTIFSRVTLSDFILNILDFEFALKTWPFPLIVSGLSIVIPSFLQSSS